MLFFSPDLTILFHCFTRYSDYKPMPPPKSSVYKPVPPPKPKPFSSRSNSQPPSMTESNYMNGNYINSQVSQRKWC